MKISVNANCEIEEVFRLFRKIETKYYTVSEGKTVKCYLNFQY